MITRRRFVASSLTAALASWGLPAWADQRFAAVLAQLQGYVDDGKLPFAAIRISRHGQVLAEAHHGGIEPVGPESRYRVYSMTKPVVAAGLMQLVDAQRLKLDDPVAAHVPAFADLQVLGTDGDTREPARTMTVAHLLTHSCGLANSWGNARVAPLYRQAGLVAGSWMYDEAIGGLEGFAEQLAQLPLEFQPGSDWIYGYGLDIAGLVVERVSGRRLGEYLRQQLFEPLGMHSTGFQVPPEHAGQLAGLYSAAGGTLAPIRNGSETLALRQPFADGGSAGLLSTLEDYGRFADMLANGGERDGVRVLSAAAVATLTSPYGEQAPLLSSLTAFGRYEAGSIGQGLGGVVRLDDRSGPGSAGEYAWGGAAGTGFWATPKLGLSVTLMTQLMPVTALPARDLLRPAIYRALAAG